MICEINKFYLEIYRRFREENLLLYMYFIDYDIY